MLDGELLRDYNIDMFGVDSIANDPKMPDLSFMKQDTQRSNDDTVFEDTLPNGSFTETILIRETDDTYIQFRVNVVLVKSLNDVYDVITKNKSTKNILIDSRLITYIACLVMVLEDELLIYNVNSLTIQTIYEFYAQNFGVQSNELTLSQIKLLFMIHLIVTLFLKDMKIIWNINNVIQSIKISAIGKATSTTTSYTLDVLVNYFRIPKGSKVSIYNVTTLCKAFYNTFSKPWFEIQPWNVSNCTMSDLHASLMILKSNQFQFVTDQINFEQS
jgi:hypothetical protein